MASHPDSSNFNKSLPWKRIDPEMSVDTGSRPRIASANVLFPDPDSPRTPTISAGLISNSTPNTAGEEASPMRGYLIVNPRTCSSVEVVEDLAYTIAGLEARTTHCLWNKL